MKLTAWHILSHCKDAEEAEAEACLEGIHLAMRWPEIPMVLESDCRTVVAKFHTTRAVNVLLYGKSSQRCTTGWKSVVSTGVGED